MRDAMRKAGLTPPLFESDRGQDLFVARYSFHHFLGPEDLTWLAGFKALHLGDDDAKALVFVKEYRAIDNAAYRDLLGVDTLAASQALRRLRDAGLLEQKGRGSATYYLPTTKLLPAAPQEGLNGEPGGLSSKPGALSSKPSALPSKLDALSSKPAALSSQPDADSQRDALLATLPGTLAARVGSLGLRARPDDVRAAVLELCTLHPWRAEDLAILLRRNAEYVRQNHLRPLMRSGQLEQVYPAEPKHPAQAYRAAPTAS